MSHKQAKRRRHLSKLKFQSLFGQKEGFTRAERRGFMWRFIKERKL